MKKQTVLVVDDIPENIDVLHGILADEYTVQAATNGKMALKIATGTIAPDLILLDVMMPEFDGYQVCKWLKDDIRTKDIPVIFVSAKSEVADEKKGFEVGAVDYITKPVSPPLVLARIHTHLALFDQNRTLETTVKKRTQEVLETRQEIIHRLGIAAEFKDNETGTHVVRMAEICRLIAEGRNMTEDEVSLIKHVAPMHDVGKIGIPDQVLLKPGKLNDTEWKTMRKHPEIGAEIIGNHRSLLLRQSKIAALTHHEKWDGSGYPKGLKGDKIPVLGRIIAIADVFDALTSDRPYKKAWAIDDAIEHIRSESGKHFDPELVDAFMKSKDAIAAVKALFSDK